MNDLMEHSRRLLIRYDYPNNDTPGQFTFRHFDPLADDEQLYELGMQLNEFQECDADGIFKVRVYAV